MFINCGVLEIFQKKNEQVEKKEVEDKISQSYMFMMRKRKFN
jgi:hypothetical protein